MVEDVIGAIHAPHLSEKGTEALRAADAEIREAHRGALSIHGPFRARFKPGVWAWNVQLAAPEGSDLLCDGWKRVEMEVRTDG